MWGIIIFVLVGLLIMFQMVQLEHHAKRLKIMAFLVIGLLLYISFVKFMGSEDLDLSSPGEIISSVPVYFSWVGETLVNFWDVGVDTVSMVGNAVKTDDDKDE